MPSQGYPIPADAAVFNQHQSAPNRSPGKEPAITRYPPHMARPKKPRAKSAFDRKPRKHPFLIQGDPTPTASRTSVTKPGDLDPDDAQDSSGDTDPLTTATGTTASSTKPTLKDVPPNPDSIPDDIPWVVDIRADGALRHPRREAFSCGVAAGLPPQRVYQMVWKCAESTARVNSRRLLQLPEVVERIATLRTTGENLGIVPIERLVQQVELSKSWVLHELRLIHRRCMYGKSFNPPMAIKALELIGKDLGMFGTPQGRATGLDGNPLPPWDGDVTKLTREQLATMVVSLAPAAFPNPIEREIWRREAITVLPEILTAQPVRSETESDEGLPPLRAERAERKQESEPGEISPAVETGEAETVNDGTEAQLAGGVGDGTSPEEKTTQ